MSSNKYLAVKEQLNTRTRPEEIISTVPDLTSSTQNSSTATAAFSSLLDSFNVTLKLSQAAISQKPEKESSSLSPPLNPAFLTPPPTVETPSQGPKRKGRRIQFVNFFMNLMLMANRGKELGIRNFELDLTM